ncbi:hypothetical protein PAHAL_5G536900 [Panicum hallii]|uniref:Uncharacterized protein n=1 Tax=Panicum hallii TaxID=206008 RepID=A0A2T8IPF7_9POAL|nr:hypothetical protein PAHAL_5G536900 [Panicum hallii]
MQMPAALHLHRLEPNPSLLLHALLSRPSLHAFFKSPPLASSPYTYIYIIISLVPCSALCFTLTCRSTTHHLRRKHRSQFRAHWMRESFDRQYEHSPCYSVEQDC